MLIIADEVCAQYSVRVVDFAALCAAAAAASASIAGIDVHRGDLRAAERSVARTIMRLEPLSARNKVLAAVAAEVLHRRRG